MKTAQAFSAPGISGALTGFAQFLRGYGMNAGIAETTTAMLAADTGLLTSKAHFRSALKAIFCTSPEECRAFEKLFAIYWDTSPVDLREEKNSTKLSGQSKRAHSAVLVGQGKSEEKPGEAKSVTGASEAERLQRTDFSLVRDMDAAPLEKLADQLFREMASRVRRRLKRAGRQGEIDMRRTIRRSIGSGGEPMELAWRMRKEKKERMIMLLDVSGSMDRYSFYLLRFVCALKDRFRQLEAFVFSTSLLRITRALNARHLETALQAISEQAQQWSGGTRIGASLGEFLDMFGKRMLNGAPTVIILSDGLETGDPLLLEAALGRLRTRARKIIWLNPLKGMAGYAPLAGGMKAALPLVDEFRSAHNLQSLLELEKILADV